MGYYHASCPSASTGRVNPINLESNSTASATEDKRTINVTITEDNHKQTILLKTSKQRTLTMTCRFSSIVEQYFDFMNECNSYQYLIKIIINVSTKRGGKVHISLLWKL
jgi:hypothetical protein